MKTILTPPLPMRLKFIELADDIYSYVIGLQFIHDDGDNDDETQFGYICTDGNVYDDVNGDRSISIRPQVFMDGDWCDWE